MWICMRVLFACCTMRREAAKHVRLAHIAGFVAGVHIRPRSFAVLLQQLYNLRRGARVMKPVPHHRFTT